MSDEVKVISTKKVHIRICTGSCKSHGGMFRPIYVYPQIRVFPFLWKTMRECPYIGNSQQVEEWVKKSYPNVLLHYGGWRDFW